MRRKTRRARRLVELAEAAGLHPWPRRPREELEGRRVGIRVWGGTLRVRWMKKREGDRVRERRIIERVHQAMRSELLEAVAVEEVTEEVGASSAQVAR